MDCRTLSAPARVTSHSWMIAVFIDIHDKYTRRGERILQYSNNYFLSSRWGHRFAFSPGPKPPRRAKRVCGVSGHTPSSGNTHEAHCLRKARVVFPQRLPCCAPLRGDRISAKEFVGMMKWKKRLDKLSDRLLPYSVARLLEDAIAFRKLRMRSLKRGALLGCPARGGLEGPLERVAGRPGAKGA